MTLLAWTVLAVCGSIAGFLLVHGVAWYRTFEPAEWGIFGIGTGASALAALHAGLVLLLA